MYVYGNPKTKKELKQWVAEGKEVRIFAPGLGTPTQTGTDYVEGPQFPEPHKWSAKVELKNGRIIEVK